MGTGRGGAEGPSCGADAGNQDAAGSAGYGGVAAVGHPPYVVCYGNVASTLAALLSARRLRCCT